MYSSASVMHCERVTYLTALASILSQSGKKHKLLIKELGINHVVSHQEHNRISGAIADNTQLVDYLFLLTQVCTSFNLSLPIISGHRQPFYLVPLHILASQVISDGSGQFFSGRPLGLLPKIPEYHLFDQSNLIQAYRDSMTHPLQSSCSDEFLTCLFSCPVLHRDRGSSNAIYFLMMWFYIVVFHPLTYTLIDKLTRIRLEQAHI